jgi:hypothetical protein
MLMHALENASMRAPMHACMRARTHALPSHACAQDPTTMLQLQKELAVQEERYSDAQHFQQQIFEEMTHSVMLRLVVAMEAAMADGRYDEAAKARDEYRRLVATQVGADSTSNKI